MVKILFLWSIFSFKHLKCYFQIQVFQRLWNIWHYGTIINLIRKIFHLGQLKWADFCILDTGKTLECAFAKPQVDQKTGGSGLNSHQPGLLSSYQPRGNYITGNHGVLGAGYAAATFAQVSFNLLIVNYNADTVRARFHGIDWNWNGNSKSQFLEFQFPFRCWFKLISTRIKLFFSYVTQQFH